MKIGCIIWSKIIGWEKVRDLVDPLHQGSSWEQKKNW